MKFLKLTVIVFVVLVIAWLYWQYTKAMQYDLKLRNIIFDHVGLKRLNGSLFLDLQNPSNLSGHIMACDITLLINNVEISKLIIDKNTFISPSAFTTLELKFDAVPRQILSIKNIFALEGILDASKVMIGFKGWIKVKKWIFTLTIPINLSDPLADYLPDKTKENEN